MNIEIKKVDKNTEIILDSRLDSTTADEFKAVLDEEVTKVEETLIINLKDVDFISSIGLRVLVSAYQQLDGKELIIKDANSSVKEILKLSGLLKIFTIL